MLAASENEGGLHARARFRSRLNYLSAGNSANDQVEFRQSAANRGDSGAVKKIAIIPTLFTLGNAVCGFAAIVFASKIDKAAVDAHLANYYFAYSGALIFLAMVFDAFDGSIARRLKTASEFGGQLDSLCDAVSFGVAPGFLLMKMGQDWTDLQWPGATQAIAVIAALYMVCAILRLARFNVQNTPDAASHKRFKGLPSPAAAGCVASLALLRSEFACDWAHLDPSMVRGMVMLCAPLGTLTVALLMVSRVSYPHLTNQWLRGRRHFSHLVKVVVAFFLLILLRELSLIIVFWSYALGFLARYSFLRLTRPQSMPKLDDVVRH
jgi:CDP-diacylglycerol--serine O-phosphatidyltransferase